MSDNPWGLFSRVTEQDTERKLNKLISGEDSSKARSALLESRHIEPAVKSQLLKDLQEREKQKGLAAQQQQQSMILQGLSEGTSAYNEGTNQPSGAQARPSQGSAKSQEEIDRLSQLKQQIALSPAVDDKTAKRANVALDERIKQEEKNFAKKQQVEAAFTYAGTIADLANSAVLGGTILAPSVFHPAAAKAIEGAYPTVFGAAQRLEGATKQTVTQQKTIPRLHTDSWYLTKGEMIEESAGAVQRALGRSFSPDERSRFDSFYRGDAPSWLLRDGKVNPADFMDYVLAPPPVQEIEAGNEYYNRGKWAALPFVGSKERASFIREVQSATPSEDLDRNIEAFEAGIKDTEEILGGLKLAVGAVGAAALVLEAAPLAVAIGAAAIPVILADLAVAGIGAYLGSKALGGIAEVAGETIAKASGGDEITQRVIAEDAERVGSFVGGMAGGVAGSRLAPKAIKGAGTKIAATRAANARAATAELEGALDITPLQNVKQTSSSLASEIKNTGRAIALSDGSVMPTPSEFNATMSKMSALSNVMKQTGTQMKQSNQNAPENLVKYLNTIGDVSPLEELSSKAENQNALIMELSAKHSDLIAQNAPADKIRKSIDSIHKAQQELAVTLGRQIPNALESTTSQMEAAYAAGLMPEASSAHENLMQQIAQSVSTNMPINEDSVYAATLEEIAPRVPIETEVNERFEREVQNKLQRKTEQMQTEALRDSERAYKEELKRVTVNNKEVPAQNEEALDKAIAQQLPVNARSAYRDFERRPSTLAQNTRTALIEERNARKAKANELYRTAEKELTNILLDYEDIETFDDVVAKFSDEFDTVIKQTALDSGIARFRKMLHFDPDKATFERMLAETKRLSDNISYEKLIAQGIDGASRRIRNELMDTIHSTLLRHGPAGKSASMALQKANKYYREQVTEPYEFGAIAPFFNMKTANLETLTKGILSSRDEVGMLGRALPGNSPILHAMKGIYARNRLTPSSKMGDMQGKGFALSDIQPVLSPGMFKSLKDMKYTQLLPEPDPYAPPDVSGIKATMDDIEVRVPVGAKMSANAIQALLKSPAGIEHGNKMFGDAPAWQAAKVNRIASMITKKVEGSKGHGFFSVTAHAVKEIYKRFKSPLLDSFEGIMNAMNRPDVRSTIEASFGKAVYRSLYKEVETAYKNANKLSPKKGALFAAKAVGLLKMPVSSLTKYFLFSAVLAKDTNNIPKNIAEIGRLRGHKDGYIKNSSNGRILENKRTPE